MRAFETLSLGTYQEATALLIISLCTRAPEAGRKEIGERAGFDSVPLCVDGACETKL